MLKNCFKYLYIIIAAIFVVFCAEGVLFSQSQELEEKTLESMPQFLQDSRYAKYTLLKGASVLSSPNHQHLKLDSFVSLESQSKALRTSKISTASYTEMAESWEQTGNFYTSQEFSTPQISKIKKAPFAVSSVIFGDVLSSGRVVFSGDRIGNGVRLSILLQSDVLISSWNMVLSNSLDQLVQRSGALLETPIATANASLLLTGLRAGVYSLRIQAKDGSVSVGSTVISMLRVAEELAITDAVVGPNPYNPNQGTVAIEYQLSESADVTFKIWSISGRLVYESQVNSSQSGGQLGFNRLIWDGRDRFGELVANGPYIMMLLAQNSHGKQMTKVKVMVLK